MSQPSDSSTASPSFVQPSDGVGGFTTLWSSSTSMNEVGTVFVMLTDWPVAMS